MERKLKESGIPWIGAIPEHWEVTKIGKICYEHFIENKTEHNQNLLSLSYGNIKRKDINTADGLLPESFDTYQIVEEGNIVLRLTDLQNDKRSLRVGRVGERGIITSAYVALGMRPYVYSKYMYFLLHTADICKVFYSFGGGVRQSGKWDDIASLRVPVPPLGEQEAIAGYLDEKCGEIDELIEVEQQMITDLEAYRQAVITEAVTHGLNPLVPLRPSGIDWIGNIPEHWEIAPMKSEGSFCKGLSFSKGDLVSSGLPVVSYGQIHSKLNNFASINSDLIRYIPENLFLEKDKAVVNWGDFVFADTSEDIIGCGNAVYNDSESPIYAGYHTVIYRRNNPNGKYYAYLFQSDCWRNQIRARATGTKVYSITQTILNTLSICIPPPTEQQAIADYLDAKCGEIAELIKVKQEKIETLKQYRQSLIFEAVTGKINIS